MSYEINSIHQIKCPCGNGEIKHIVEDNDWGQTRERIEILCDDCKKNYEIVSKHVCPKPKHDYWVYYCKSKETGEKIKLDF